MRRPEEALHRAVAAYLSLIERQVGIWWCHPANGGARTKAEAGIFRALGVKAGTPDILVIKGGHAFWLELKAPRGHASPAQVETIGRLEAVDCPCQVCRSLDDVQDALKSWEIIT